MQKSECFSVTKYSNASELKLIPHHRTPRLPARGRFCPDRFGLRLLKIVVILPYYILKLFIVSVALQLKISHNLFKKSYKILFQISFNFNLITEQLKKDLFTKGKCFRFAQVSAPVEMTA